MKKTIYDNFIIQTIVPVIKKHGEQAFVVGGFLRDCILGRKSCDVDIVVPKGHAKTFAQRLADEICGYFVELDDENKIYRVVFEDKENYVDIAQCVGENIKEDLLRRDFTINALAFDLLSNELIDIVGAQKDLKNGIIREISKENILEDSIRILRAFRFKSQLGFEFSDNLNIIIKDFAQKIAEPAKERVNVELLKLFEGKFAHDVILDLDKYGILELILPEVKAIKTIPPNSHHHLDLFHHCVETVRHVQEFYENSCEDAKKHLGETDLGSVKRLSYLKFAAFLHDVGKPATWQIEPETGRHRFITHDSVGAKIIVSTLKNLKFSKKQIAYIQKIIKYHIYPASVVTSEDAGEKAYFRFYRKMENDVIDLIAVAYGDRLSTLGPEITQEMVTQNINGLKTLLQGYFAQKDKLVPLPKLIDGNEIMALFNLKASPKLGELISKLKEAQISGDVNSKDEAIEFLKKIL